MRRTRRTAPLAALALSVALAADGSPLHAQAGDLSATGRVSSGGWLRVSSGNGPMEVIPGGGDQVQIVGERMATRGGSRDPVRLEVLNVGGDMVVCAVTDYSECTDEGIRSTERRRDGGPEPVRFTIHVPAGTNVRLLTGNGELSLGAVVGDVVASTGNGDVRILGTSGTVRASSGNGALEIDGASGPVEASTGNGRIEARTASGPVSATTGNGRIVVEMASIAGDGDLEFRTGSGEIELILPDGIDAELVSQLGNGTVSSDFPLMLEGRMNQRNFRAMLGDGGRRISVSSGNGDLVLRRP